MSFSRRLKAPNRSFFLFGPRATGKSTWLKASFSDKLYVDLLRNDTYFLLMGSPTVFREKILACDPHKTWIIVDEIQRIPALLNDVHSLIESHGYRFALSGSSSRKLKRGDKEVNLLAGRALLKHMFSLTAKEYEDSITIEEVLKSGSLPGIILDPDFRIEQLEAYVGTYLREEIKEEALTRNVHAFSRFLDVAGLMNGQVTNLSNIARDSAVARATVSTYFDILVDTLLGNWLPAWSPRAKVREVGHPKFYFFDPGVVRSIQKLLRDPVTSSERGFLFETVVFNELNAHISYENIGGELFYWKTAEDIEIDFIWKRGTNVVAIEVKSTSRWRNEYNAGMRSFQSSAIKIKACYGIYLGEEILQQEWGLVLPWKEFLKRLYAGEIIG